MSISVANIVRDMEMQSTSNPMNAKGQGHLVNLFNSYLIPYAIVLANSIQKLRL